MAEIKKPDVKRREGLPMNEKSYADWQKSFKDIEESIQGLKNEWKSGKKSKKRS